MIKLIKNKLMVAFPQKKCDGWVGGSKSRFKDCLQQSKFLKMRPIKSYLIELSILFFCSDSLYFTPIICSFKSTYRQCREPLIATEN